MENENCSSKPDLRGERKQAIKKAK